MKICAFSDIHGNLKFNVEPCDIVLIAGDIIPLKVQTNSYLSKRWLNDTFIPWCNNLPCEKVVFIAGNHDFFMFYNPDNMKDMLKDNDKVIYLDCETYEYKDKIVYGTPICKIFGGWAFMEPYEQQDERYEKALEQYDKIDVILSHDAPYGTSDIILQKDCPWATGEHIGNESLAKFVTKASPELLLHGHLHSTNHEKELLNNTNVYNVSLLDENYNLTYKPLYIEI